MLRRSASVAETKARLSDVLREVENGTAIVITRHGKPVAALVRPEDLVAIERLRSAGPEAGLVSIVGGWAGSDEFVDAVRASPRRGRRRVPRLD